MSKNNTIAVLTKPVCSTVIVWNTCITGLFCLIWTLLSLKENYKSLNFLYFKMFEIVFMLTHILSKCLTYTYADG